MVGQNNMNKKTATRVLLILLIVILTVAAALIAVKLNSKNPLDSSIGNTKTRATYQKQIEIPNVIIPPTEAPSPTITAQTGVVVSPTQTLLAVAPTSQISPTESVVVVAQTSPTTTMSVTTSSPTDSVVTTETLPAAGSFQSLLILALAASTVVVVSLLL